jgi:hypothetical protein
VYAPVCLGKEGGGGGGMIRSYDYKPKAFNFFGGDPRKDLMLGVELDVY